MVINYSGFPFYVCETYKFEEFVLGSLHISNLKSITHFESMIIYW